MNLLFKDNQFKNSLRVYNPNKDPTKKDSKKPTRKKPSLRTTVEPARESGNVIDLNDKRFDLTPELPKRSNGISTSKETEALTERWQQSHYWEPFALSK